jgi:hypothetical protein
MKTNLLLISMWFIGALTTAGFAQDNRTSCLQLAEQKYDKFKDTTTTILKPRRILQIASPREELDLSAQATIKGQSSGAPKEVDMIFSSAGEKWHYYDKADVIFILEGKRLEAGTAYVLQGLPGPLLVKETLKLTLPFDTFLQIANSKEAELSLGPTKLQLKGSDLQALRSFANCISGH